MFYGRQARIISLFNLFLSLSLLKASSIFVHVCINVLLMCLVKKLARYVLLHMSKRAEIDENWSYLIFDRPYQPTMVIFQTDLIRFVDLIHKFCIGL